VSLAYWIKLTRSGSTFNSYGSPDGVNWVQLGSSQTVTMAQNVYVGLAVSSRNTSLLATATFDNVSLSSSAAPAPAITSVSATTGSVGSQVVISGSGFGTVGLVTLNGALVTMNVWSGTAISITIPTGATSGPLAVAVAPGMNGSNAVPFAVTSQPLPSSWLDQDLGLVGVSGSGTFASETFTVKGAGQGTFFATADGIHFVYQPFSGDGTIVTRVVSTQGGGSQEVGVMFRETLDPGAKHAFAFEYSSQLWMTERTSTGGSTDYQSLGGGATPYWVKLNRSGSTFTSYGSPDGVNWVQLGSSQTVSMATNVYVGMAVTNRNTSSLATATFDNVSISSTSAPAPVITNVSATTGSVGSQVAITGTGFGASQGGSLVTLNNTAVTVGYWTSTSIIITIPSGATSGPLVVSVAPNMNNSNPILFTVTTQPLPVPWLDQDIGAVGVAGSGTYASGTFTAKGAGLGTFNTTADAVHFVYQQLSGDGTIVARVVTLPNNGPEAGVMIRETLDAGARNVFAAWYQSYTYMMQRTSPGATNSYQNYSNVSLPYWLKLARSGNLFTGYSSSDGVTWVQMGSSLSITMATSAYVGLAVSIHTSTSSLATATFDNVSVTIGTTPFVSGVSPDLGSFSTSVTISGSNFGASQGTSTVSFNGAQAASVTSWNATQIVATVPNTAPSGPGPVKVTVNSAQSNTNVYFNVISPVINSLSPPQAPLSGYVKVNGTGFGPSQGTSQVKFNGVTASYYSSWSDTQINVQVPSGNTTGPLTVTVNGIVSNSVQFTLIGSLSVNSMTPTVGPVGTSVTITGAGFGATQSNSAVNFWGTTTAAAITSWSNTQIVAAVPSGTTTGPVSVTVAGQTSAGPWFNITASARLTDSLGNTTSYGSQVIGGLWSLTNTQGSGCSTCTSRGNITYTYDGRGNILTETDALGYVTTNTYDSLNNLLSVSKSIGGGVNAVTSYTYNSLGGILTTTDPLGNVTTNTYDSKGDLLTVTTPAPNGSTAASVTTFTYDSKGELLTIKDPLNNVTTLTYYPTGLINTITDAQQNVTTYAYDAHGNRTSVTDALNHQTTFAYDAADRLTTITYPGSTGTTTFGYDYRGRRTSVTDQNGKTTTYAYDDADRLTSVTDAATPGNVTTYGYDTESNLTSIQDANNHTTSFAYDAFGRVTRMTFPSGYIETYGYDADNNLSNKTDRKNQQITYTYDQLNRLTGKTYPDSTAVNYTYDKNSHLTQVTDPTGTYQFTFDNMGRLTSTTTSYAFLTGRNFTTSYSYDAASNRTGFTDPESGATSYVYDTLNRLQTLTPPAAFTSSGNFGFTYDALSRRTQMTRPNGLKSIYAYDNLSRLLSVLHQSGSTTLDGAAYAVDNAGNRTSRTPQPSGTASNYAYDAIYQLTGVTQNSTTTESYTYDPVGNRLSSLGVSSYTNNPSNDLTSTSAASYTYDNNGNTLTKVVGSDTTSYVWDFENRLSSVNLPGSGGTVTFKYNPAGRRVYKLSSNGTSVFVYDGSNLVEETNSAGLAVARYLQTENIDEPLAMVRSSITSYYHADGLGSVTSLSSAAGSIANTYTYDSSGKMTASTGSLVNPFRYTARESDTETGLYYYRARYYDSGIGRFLSEDPIAFKGGMNFFSYGKNNPVNYVDPSGLLSVCCRQVKSTAFILCHCFLVLNDNKTTMGGYKDGLTLHPEQDWPDDNPAPKRSQCDAIPGACDLNVRRAFDDIKKDANLQGGGFNYFTDGTSNTVAGEILRRAGIKYNFPWCAWGSGMPLGINSPTTGGAAHK
jgi:RHS repeat-associated protein